MPMRNRFRTLLGITPRPTVVPNSAAVTQVQTPSTIPSIQNSPTKDPESSKQVSHNRALERAIRRELDSLPAVEQEAFRKASKDLTDENILLKVKKWDDAHKAESYFRPKAETLSRFLGLLDRFMAGVSIGIQANPDISAIVVGGVRVVIDQAVKFVGFFDKLSDMLCRFSDFLETLHEYDSSSAQNTLIVETLANVYGDLLQFCKHAHAVFTYQGVRRRMTSWRTFWHIQWMPFEEEFSKIESSMQHHIQILNNAAQAVTLKATLDLHDQERERREKDRVAERESFLNWISSIPFERVHEDIHAKKHPQTGEWLVQTRQFQDWFHSPASTLLWCYGNPGAGKSVLASNVLEHITSHHSPHRNVGICFSYYSYQSPEMADLSQIISALVKQLCRKRDIVPTTFLRAKQDSLPPSTLGNQSSFLTVAQGFSDIFLLIDGLDECPEDKRSHVLGFLKFVLEKLPRQKIRIFVTSRRESDIARAFDQLGAPKIEIEAKSVAADITKYVTDEIEKLRQGYDGKKLYVKSKTLEQKIIDTLTTKADCMFLWTSLQIANLCRVSQSQMDSELEKELNTLPLGLDATYIRALEQIEKQPSNLKELAYKCFMLVMHATRELSIIELRHALSTDTEKLHNDKQEMELYPVDTILGACANLLVERDYPWAKKYNTVRPVHFSVQEFIQNPPEGVLKKFSLRKLNDVPYINAQLASICVSYLQSCILEGPCSNPILLWERIDSIPFAWYASCAFDYHITRCGDLPDELHRRVLAFLGQEQRFLSAVLQLRTVGSEPGYSHLPAALTDFTQPYLTADGNTLVCETELYNLPSLRYQWEDLRPAPFALHRACFAGLGGVVSRVLSDGQKVNEADADGICPIYYAACRGHTHILTMLLDNGADVNVQGGDHGTALQVASLNGYEHIVQQLLNHRVNNNTHGRDHGIVQAETSLHDGSNGVGTSFSAKVDVNANCGEHGTALQAAAFGGHLKTVRLLLKYNAHVNLEGGRQYGFALHAASYGGHQDIVELLLDRGANISAEGGEYGFALHAASYRGHQDIVELLLDRGANISAEGGEYGFALHAASYRGHQDIVELLLERGSNINAEGGHYSFALHAASLGGHQDIVELLLERGSNINAEGGHYGFALHAASLGGHQDIVELLLERGANINAEGGHYSFALHAASYRGHQDIIELLLERGSNINAEGGHYGFALHAASYRDHQDIVELLLERGANINAEGGYYGFALHAASLGGHQDIVELLLERGSNINAEGGHYGFALHAASLGGHQDIVELLLERGSNINAEGGYYGFALHAASYGGHKDIIELVIDRGADIHSHNNSGETALHKAAEPWNDGARTSVELLLFKGADIHARDDRGETPLHKASESGCSGVVDLLLSNGADIHTRTNDGRTALQMASDGVSDPGRAWRREGCAAVVELLLSKGAVYDENPSGNNDVTAAEEADGGGTAAGFDEDEAWTNASDEADDEELFEADESDKARLPARISAA